MRNCCVTKYFYCKNFPTFVRRFLLRHNKISMNIILRVYRRFGYHIAGNFRVKKLLQIGENTIFAEKTFVDCSLLSCRRTTTPQISRRKLSRIATKLRNLRKFSPSKVFRYKVTEVQRSDFPLQFMTYKPLQLTSTKTVTNRWPPRPDCHSVVVT